MQHAVSKKIGIKANMRSIVIGLPDDAAGSIDLRDADLKKRLSGKFDYMHLFVRTQDAFHKQFPRLIPYLDPSGMLWISWPKGGKEQTDLNIRNVIRIGYEYDMVESKAISINETWSALKFTHPKEGKIYQNSYGKLKSRS